RAEPARPGRNRRALSQRPHRGEALLARHASAQSLKSEEAGAAAAGRVGPLTRSARCDGQGKTATRWDNRGFSPLPVEARVTSLTIEPIEDAMWAGIQRVQSEVYLDVEPESTEILRSKWLHSPACCFAMRKGDE